MSKTKQIVEERLNEDLLYSYDEKIIFIKEFLIAQYRENYVEDVRAVWSALPSYIRDEIKEVEEVIYN